MRAQKLVKAKHFLFIVLAAVMMMAFTGLSAMAGEKILIEEGTYYIKAINGNANGQVLYWDEDASDQNICMMFESCGGKHADNEVWFITTNRNYDDYNGIYLASDYYGNKDKCNRIEIDNLTGRDQPYIGSTKGPHVFCGPFSNQDDAFEFRCENDVSSYTNLTIWSHDEGYKFNRHKEVKLFKHDLIYVNANKDNDNNKLWELIPVNYVRGMSQTAPASTAKKHGKVIVKWDELREKFKDDEVWLNAVYVEVQCSTDKNFMKNVKTKKIEKGTVDLEKVKTTVSKLKKNKTYYIRARLIDSKDVASNWSKTIKIKTKKK